MHAAVLSCYQWNLSRNIVDWSKFFRITDVKVLLYLQQHDGARYSQLLNLIEARSMLSRSLQDLQRRKLVERTIEQSHPIKTRYHLSDKGKKLVQHLAEIQKLLE
jgi:DNA-binding HxlR family transcriptional regulator